MVKPGALPVLDSVPDGWRLARRTEAPAGYEAVCNGFRKADRRYESALVPSDVWKEYRARRDRFFHKESYQANKEARIAYQKQYAKAHPEKIREASARYWERRKLREFRKIMEGL